MRNNKDDSRRWGVEEGIYIGSPSELRSKDTKMKAWINKDPYNRTQPIIVIQEEKPAPKFYDKPFFDECEMVEWKEVFITDSNQLTIEKE